MNSGMFEARNLMDRQFRHGDADVDQRLDLEAIAPEITSVILRQDSLCIEPEDGKMLLPENVEAIAQICIPGPAKQIHQAGQHTVAKAAQPGNILAASALGEPGSLGKVSAGEQCRYKVRDLTGIG